MRVGTGTSLFAHAKAQHHSEYFAKTVSGPKNRSAMALASKTQQGYRAHW